MICRNCSAEIEDGLSVCPKCKKDPAKRDYDKKSNKRGPVIIILIAACLLAACIFAGSKLKEAELFTTSDITINESFESTDLTFEPTSENTEVSTETQTSTTESTSAQVEATAYAADFSLSDPTIVIRKIKDENKTTVAKYGYIEAPKNKFKKLSQSKFSTFCENIVEESKLEWLTVKFEDSTGLVFNGDNEEFAIYCKLNKNNYIESTIGYVILDRSDNYIYIPCSSKTQPTKSETNEVTETTETTAQTTEAAEDDFFAETTEETTSSTETSSDIVYVTKSGTKYHRASCSYLSSSKIEISLSQAKSKGYTPCSRCFN